jgi:DNA-binding NarL/FixJ family response regulator
MFGYGSDDPPAPQIIQDFVEGLESRQARLQHGTKRPVVPLSARELEVLRLVAQGKSNRQIADELVISAATVAKHVNSILSKTESRNRAGAASFAHRQGIL